MSLALRIARQMTAITYGDDPPPGALWREYVETRKSLRETLRWTEEQAAIARLLEWLKGKTVVDDPREVLT